MVWNELLQNDEEYQCKGYDDTEKMLSLAVNEGLLEIQDDAPEIKWIHDKVQEAAFALVPDDKMVAMKFKVGTILNSKLSKEERDV